MYTSNKGYILKGGVKLSTAETIDLLYSLQNKSDKWDELEEEIGSFYEDEDNEEGNLCAIGETCAIAFGYL